MLSRVADSIFWMRRYTERAENIARFIDVTLHLTLGLGDQIDHQWEALIYTTGDQEGFFASYPKVTQEDVISFLTFDETNPNSILSCLQFARENDRQSREMLSSPIWEELNKFYLFVRESRNDTQAVESPFEFFAKVRQFGYLIEGVVSGTMSHVEAWNFGRLGAMLERADKTSRILDVKYFLLLPSVRDVGTSLDISQWGMLLKSASALEMYRRKFGRLSPNLVAAFLLLDRDFPRAVRFCISRAEQSLLQITGGTQGNFSNRPEQLLGRLRAELEFLDIEEVMDDGLHEFIDDFQSKLNDIGVAVFEKFFQVQS
ncbi:MAG: alpha-E domain-containing protein [Pirellula sp.]